MPAREFYKLSEINIDYLHRLIEPYIFEADFSFDRDVYEKIVQIDAGNKAEELYQERKESLLHSLYIEIGQSVVEQFTNLAVACFSDKERHLDIAKHLSGQIIVFCTLLEEVKLIASQIDCYVITGETKNRDQIIEQFQEWRQTIANDFWDWCFWAESTIL